MQQSRRHSPLANRRRHWVRGGCAVAGALAGIAAYVYVMTSVNLPEEIEPFIAAGVALGLLIGHWLIVLGALSTLSIAVLDPLGPDRELWTLIWFVYLPAAAVSIAVGVGLRKLVASVGRRS